MERVRVVLIEVHIVFTLGQAGEEAVKLDLMVEGIARTAWAA